MAIMITNAAVAQSAPIGTLVGNLNVYQSGATVPSYFSLDAGAAGLFAINGAQLVTAHALLPVGYYAIKVWAMAQGAAKITTGRFIISVTPPPAPPPPAPPPPPPPAPPAPPPPPPPPPAT